MRRVALLVHLTVSVGWIGAVLAFLSLVVSARGAQDQLVLRSTWLTLDTMGRTAIVPLAIASLLSGLLMGLGTRWGLLRHYWVVASLVLTTVATAVLLDNMRTVRTLATLAVDPSSDDLATLRRGLDGELLHAGLGLIVLLVVLVLNVAKPRGRTRRGHRLAVPADGAAS